MPAWKQKKMKLKFRQKCFVGLNYSKHMTKTHGKLSLDYITGSCTHEHDYYSHNPTLVHNLIVHPSVARHETFPFFSGFLIFSRQTSSFL